MDASIRMPVSAKQHQDAACVYRVGRCRERSVATALATAVLSARLPYLWVELG